MRFLLLIAIVCSIAAGAFFFVGSYAIDHVTGPVRTEQHFEVRSGENALELGARLEESGLVFSRYAFLWYLSREQITHQLVAGTYLISGAMTIPEIGTLVTSGKVVSRDIRVTFPEGWTMTKMAERLTANGLPGEEFLKLAEKPLPEWRKKYAFLGDLPATATLEGYLFPDTYLFAPDAAPEDIITIMLNTFGKKLASIPGFGSDTNFAIDSKRLHETITLASIIEEEGRTAEERDMISDIFRKRLAVGQALQSDATVNYVHGTTRLQPTLEDINSDSPYNTYKHPGLPPGPISNPGLVSLHAALYPKANPYFYFLVSAKTNETIYSVTFEEHVRNRMLHGL